MRLAESERAEFVSEACGDDRSLRREVTALLDHDGPLDVADAPSRAALEELVARLKSGGD